MTKSDPDSHNKSRSEKIKSGIERAKAVTGKWGRPTVLELRGDLDLPTRASELRSGGFSWSQIASRLGVSRSSARRLVNLCQKEAESQTDHHINSPVPNRDVSDTRVKRIEPREAVEGDAGDAVQFLDVSTNDEVLAKMPKTFQIFSSLLTRVRDMDR